MSLIIELSHLLLPLEEMFPKNDKMRKSSYVIAKGLPPILCYSLSGGRGGITQTRGQGGGVLLSESARNSTKEALRDRRAVEKTAPNYMGP